jgi:hypothetical protein
LLATEIKGNDDSVSCYKVPQAAELPFFGALRTLGFNWIFGFIPKSSEKILEIIQYFGEEAVSPDVAFNTVRPVPCAGEYAKHPLHDPREIRIRPGLNNEMNVVTHNAEGMNGESVFFLGPFQCGEKELPHCRAEEDILVPVHPGGNMIDRVFLKFSRLPHAYTTAPSACFALTRRFFLSIRILSVSRV